MLPPAVAAIVERAADREAAETLVREALTHRTWVNEHPGAGDRDNQRLELLGDAVLELVVTHALYDALPTADEGLLSRGRASLVNEGSLSTAALGIDLGPALRLGRGEESSGGRERPRVLADALEALVGASYLASGLEGARAFVADVLGHAIERAVVASADDAPIDGVDARVKDAKSVLQEIVQRDGGEPPLYEVEATTGPVHERTFTVCVTARGKALGRGLGRSRREAEMRAATEALATLGHASGGDPT